MSENRKSRAGQEIVGEPFTGPGRRFQHLDMVGQGIEMLLLRIAHNDFDFIQRAGFLGVEYEGRRMVSGREEMSVIA